MILRQGDYVVVNDRVGRWSDTTSSGLAVVVSGYDVFVVDVNTLTPAFPKENRT